MTSNSVKIRSLFLSALMVFSVFAGTVALAGSAAAAGNNPGSGPDIDSATHYNQTNSGQDGTAVLEVAFNENVNFGTITDSDTEVFLQADGTRVDVIQSGSASLESGFAVRTASGGQLVIDTGDSVYNEVDNVTITNFEDDDGETTSSVTADVTFAASTVDAQTDDSTTVDSQSTVEAYQGSNVSLINGDNTDVTFNIAGADNNVDRNRGTGQNSETYALNTDGLDLGDYYVTASSGNSSDFNVTLELQDLGLTVTSDETAFDSNEDITGTVETNDINRGVDVELVDDSGDVVEETTANTGADGEVDYTFSAPSDDWDAGNYTVNVTDQNTQVTETTDEFEIVEVGDETASFETSSFSEARGDIVNVTILFDNTDTATVQFGDFEDDNYNITAEVVDDDGDGQAYVEFNTFLAGTGNPSNVLAIGGDGDEISNQSQGGSFSSNYASRNTFDIVGEDILEASDYDVLVEAGEMQGTTVNNEDDVATLSLQERSTDSANLWTAPSEDFDDLAGTDADGVVEFVEAGNLTQASTIAEGDAMVVEVSANGLEGAFSDTSEYQTLSGNEQFFSLILEEDTAAANADPNSINVNNFAAENVSVIYADTEGAGADTHYVVLNSEAVANAAGTGNYSHSDGDGYVANFTVYGGDDATSDLADANASVQDDASIENAEVDIETDPDTDEFVVLEAADGQELTGDTNLAPGTELTIRLRSDGAPVPFLKQPETIVQSDGTFTATANFSAENVGGNFTVQPRVGTDNIPNSYDGYLVEATEEPTTETPTDDGTEVTETEATEEPTAPPTDEPTEEPTTEEETTTMGEMTEEETTAMEGTDTAAEETTTPGSGPGFTAAIALIALVAAALLAVRRDN